MKPKPPDRRKLFGDKSVKLGDEPVKFVTTKIPARLWKAVKVMAAVRDITIAELLVQYIKKGLERIMGELKRSDLEHLTETLKASMTEEEQKLSSPFELSSPVIEEIAKVFQIHPAEVQMQMAILTWETVLRDVLKMFDDLRPGKQVSNRNIARLQVILAFAVAAAAYLDGMFSGAVPPVPAETHHHIYKLIRDIEKLGK